MPPLVDGIIAVFIIVGAAFTLIGSVGLVRLPDFYMRLHGPTKATTLGVGAILIASVMYTAVTLGTFSLHEVLITVFLFITAPISAHMLIKAALHLKLKQEPITRNRPWVHPRHPRPDDLPK